LARRLALLALVASAVAVGVPGQAAAKGPAIHVCPSGCAYSSIQDAINAAPNGATIAIAASTYTGGLNTDGKNLMLLGAGAGQTTISGGGLAFEIGPVVEIDSGTVTISGVTITGGNTVFSAAAASPTPAR
jgi:hypothetical protein